MWFERDRVIVDFKGVLKIVYVVSLQPIIFPEVAIRTCLLKRYGLAIFSKFDYWFGLAFPLLLVLMIFLIVAGDAHVLIRQLWRHSLGAAR